MEVNNLNLVRTLKENQLKLKITEIEVECEIQIKHFPYHSFLQRPI